jgi:hypothetical protein
MSYISVTNAYLHTYKKNKYYTITNSDGTKWLWIGWQYYKQTDGLAMGAPTSILAETYIQHVEHKYIWS